MARALVSPPRPPCGMSRPQSMTLAGELEYDAVLDEAIDDGACGHGIGEDLRPVHEGEVCCDRDACAFIAFGDDLEKQVRRLALVRNVAEFAARAIAEFRRLGALRPLPLWDDSRPVGRLSGVLRRGQCRASPAEPHRQGRRLCEARAVPRRIRRPDAPSRPSADKSRTRHAHGRPLQTNPERLAQLRSDELGVSPPLQRNGKGDDEQARRERCKTDYGAVVETLGYAPSSWELRPHRSGLFKRIRKVWPSFEAFCDELGVAPRRLRS